MDFSRRKGGRKNIPEKKGTRKKSLRVYSFWKEKEEGHKGKGDEQLKKEKRLMGDLNLPERRNMGGKRKE